MSTVQPFMKIGKNDVTRYRVTYTYKRFFLKNLNITQDILLPNDYLILNPTIFLYGKVNGKVSGMAFISDLFIAKPIRAELMKHHLLYGEVNWKRLANIQDEKIQHKNDELLETWMSDLYNLKEWKCAIEIYDEVEKWSLLTQCMVPNTVATKLILEHGFEHEWSVLFLLMFLMKKKWNSNEAFEDDAKKYREEHQIEWNRDTTQSVMKIIDKERARIEENKKRYLNKTMEPFVPSWKRLPLLMDQENK